jgi:hypothetical protein
LKDSDNIDIEEDNTIIRPIKPNHVDIGKPKIKEGHIEVLNRFGYIDNVEWVRLGGEELVPNQREDKVVVFWCFLKAGLRFPVYKTIVAVLKRFNIYLHQLTTNAIVCLGFLFRQFEVRELNLMPELSTRLSVIFMNCVSRQRRQGACIIILVPITLCIEEVQCS